MRRQTLSRAAAVTAGMLAGAQGYEAWRHSDETVYIAVLAGVAALVGALAAVRLWRRNCVECRMVTAALALCTFLGHLLVMAVGLPGQAQPDQMPVSAALVVIFAAGTLLLLALSSSHSRARSRTPDPVPPRGGRDCRVQA